MQASAPNESLLSTPIQTPSVSLKRLHSGDHESDSVESDESTNRMQHARPSTPKRPCTCNHKKAKAKINRRMPNITSNPERHNARGSSAQSTNSVKSISTTLSRKTQRKKTSTKTRQDESHSELPTLPSISLQNFNVVYNTLYSARAKWYDLGLALELPIHSLKSIEMNEHFVSERCLREMLCKRIEMKQLSWEEVVTALSSQTVNRNDLVETIQKGELNYSNKADVVYSLSGRPTLDELCALPVEKVWYPLGVWLGVEDKILCKEKSLWPSNKVEWIFTEFLNLSYTDELISLVHSEEGKHEAKELLDQSNFIDFMKLIPANEQSAAEKLVHKNLKYHQLVRALVNVGQRILAEEVCSKKGMQYIYHTNCDPKSFSFQ